MDSTSDSSRRRFLQWRHSPPPDPATKAKPSPRDWTAEQEPWGYRRAQRSVWALMRSFFGLLQRHRGRVVLAVATLIVATMLGLLMPLSTMIAFDYILTDSPGPEGLAWVGLGTDRTTLLWILGGAMVVNALLMAAAGTAGRALMTRLNKLLQAELRRRLFAHMARLPLHRLHAIKSGGVSSILREDAGVVGDMLFNVFYNPLRAVVTLLGGLTALAIIDWRMLVGGLLLIPAVYYSHRTWVGRIRPVQRAIRQNRTAMDAHATEAFAGIRVVRAYARAAGESLHFVRNNNFMARQEILVWWWMRFVEVIWVILIPLASAGALVYGGTQVLNGSLTIGQVAAFIGYLMMLLGPLDVLVSTSTAMQSGLAGFDRCLDVLAEKPEFADLQRPHGTLRSVSRESTHGDIDLEGVSFAYPSRTELVLQSIDLRVPAGTTVALVGPSGSGKTTLCNLVARFFDPTQGRVTLDGTDLRDIDVESYRRLLGIVEQEVFLFDGTIAENVAYARRGATPEQIRQAARSANADAFIEAMERGYDTMIGERGVRLSGGQKQRIAIARALLADPRILILDEATSNLDTESERLIQASLARLMRGRTCFVIAHRLSTVRTADHIVVLDHGRIIESGTHEALTASGGRYARMLALQLSDPPDLELPPALSTPGAGA